MKEHGRSEAQKCLAQFNFISSPNIKTQRLVFSELNKLCGVYNVRCARYAVWAGPLHRKAGAPRGLGGRAQREASISEFPQRAPTWALGTEPEEGPDPHKLSALGMRLGFQPRSLGGGCLPSSSRPRQGGLRRWGREPEVALPHQVSMAPGARGGAGKFPWPLAQ